MKDLKKDLNYALRNAALDGKAETVKLVLQMGADVNARDKNGDTFLHRATERERGKAIKVLLEVGADVNARNNKGRTPLLIAALCCWKRVQNSPRGLPRMASRKETPHNEGSVE